MKDQSSDRLKTMISSLEILGLIVIVSLLIFITTGYYSGNIAAGDYAVSIATIALTIATLVLALQSGRLARIEETRDLRERNLKDLDIIFKPLHAHIQSQIDKSNDWLRDNDWLLDTTIAKRLKAGHFSPPRFRPLGNDLNDLDKLRNDALEKDKILDNLIRKGISIELETPKDDQSPKISGPVQRALTDAFYNPILLVDKNRFVESLRKIDLKAFEPLLTVEEESTIKKLAEEKFDNIVLSTGNARLEYEKSRNSFMSKLRGIHSGLAIAVETEGERFY